MGTDFSLLPICTCHPFRMIYDVYLPARDDRQISKSLGEHFPQFLESLTMYLYTIVLLFLAAVGLAQYPLGPNITDLALTYQFDVGLGFFENDPQARAILNGPKKVTVLTVLNIPFNTYVARLQAAPPSDAKDLLINGVLNLTLDSELVRYLILDGVYSSASLFGGLKFLPSFLVDRRTYLLSQPAKVGIFNDKTGFYIRTGENFTSDIVLKVSTD